MRRDRGAGADPPGGRSARRAAGRESSFDTIFAINVNHFWTQPDSPALDMLALQLKAAGRLALFSKTPSPERIASIETIVRERLAGTTCGEVTSTSSPLLFVTARRA